MGAMSVMVRNGLKLSVQKKISFKLVRGLFVYAPLKMLFFEELLEEIRARARLIHGNCNYGFKAIVLGAIIKGGFITVGVV